MTNFKSTLKHLLGGVAIGACFASFVSGPAMAQSDNWNALFDRIIRLEAKVKQSGGAGGASSQRITALEQQMQQMNYQMQQMRQQLQQLEKARREGKLGPKPIRPSNNAVASTGIGAGAVTPLNPGGTLQPQNNSDDELQIIVEMEKPGTAGSNVQTGTMPNAVVTTANNNTANNGTITQQPLSPPNQPGFNNQPPNDNQQQPGFVDQQSGAVQPPLVPEKVETAALDGNQITGLGPEEKLYQSGYTNMLNRQFNTAEAQFTEFLSKYGSHKRVPAVRLYLGETYYLQGKYKLAAQSYLTSFRQNPKSDQAPETLLKLGMAMNKLGQKEQACSAYNQIKVDYPQARQIITQAQTQASQSGCN